MAPPPIDSHLIRLDPHPDAADVGGKAASIARLLELGASVPPTWLIPMDVLRWHVQKLGVAPLAQQIETLDDGPGRWRLARELQSQLLNSELPPELDAQLLDLFDSTSAVDGWALRASASCESVAGASFAGQFATYLGVRRPATTRTAVRACWASVWSPRSLAYRRILRAFTH